MKYIWILSLIISSSIFAETVGGPGSVLPVKGGGTGASTAAGARINLGVSASGDNTDITSLTGLNKQNSIQIGPYGTSAGNTGNIRFLELTANGSNYIGFKAPDTIAANIIWVLPSSEGTSGYALKTNGAGVLSFGSVVGSLNGSTLSTQTFATSTSGTNFTIDSSGLGVHTFNIPIASATNTGKLSSTDWSTFNSKQSVDSTLTALAAFDTNGILTQTATDTFTARTLTGTTDQITVTNGSGVAGNPTFSLPNPIVVNVTGTASGNQPLDSTLTSLAAYNTNGIITQTAADTFVGRTLTGTASKLTITNGDGVSGNPTFTIASDYVGQTSLTTLGTISTGTWSADTIAVNKGGTGQTSYTNGQLLIGNTTGNTLAKATLTGTSNQIVVTNGTGTITLSTPQDINSSANPTFGTVTANLVGNVTGTASGDQPLDSTLTSLAGYNTNGIITQTAADTFVGRTITGTADKITVTNGDGVSGNPTLTVASTYTGQNTIVTTGTLTSGALGSGFTAVTAPLGGTGQTSYSIGDILYASASNVLSKAIGNTSATINFLSQTGDGMASAAPIWKTPTQTTASLNNMVGDSGAGGTKGLVPAPSAGDASAGKFLKADGTWALGGSSRSLTPCRVASTTHLSFTYANGTSGVGATLTAGSNGVNSIDGVSVVLGDRILVKDQSSPKENGVYQVSTEGTAMVTGIFTRVTEFDQDAEILIGTNVLIEAGATNVGTIWFESIAGPFTVGTDNIVFAKIEGTAYTGTTNQVIVTGHVLSTPQDIGTSSNVSFGTVTASSSLKIKDTGGDHNFILTADYDPNADVTLYLPNLTGGSSAWLARTPNSDGSPSVSGVTGTLSVANGGTNKNLTVSNGGILWTDSDSFEVLTATATANKMLLSGSNATPSWSTSTIPTSAGATTGKILKSDGTNYVLSTSTFSDAPSTAGKMMVSDGTNWATSTPTFPNASATSGKFIRSDGTNWIASTPTLPTSAGTAGKVLTSDGTNYIESTPTFPNASATSGKFIRSDGTNWIASTPTLPTTAGTSGNLWISDGTNLTSVAASGAFTINSSGVATKQDLSCRLTKGSTQALTASTPAVITFGSEDFDTDTMHDTGSNTGRVTFTTAGKYCIGFTIGISVNATIYLSIRKNGTTTLATTYAGNANTTGDLIMTMDNFSATDYVEVLATSGLNGNATTECKGWAFKVN